MRTSIQGFEDMYEIDENGNIYNISSFRKPKDGSERPPLKVSKNSSVGYMKVNLSKSRKNRIPGARRDEHKRFIHRLVAQAFIPNPLGKPEVNHIDGVKSNNHVSNLEWVTCSENIRHAIDTGLIQHEKVEIHKIDPFTNQILEIFLSWRDVKSAGFKSNSMLSKCFADKNKIYKGFKWMKP